ncbi:MAG: hypothetical protein D6721_05305 [Gammaproteobacteria bacterium]|nr:MAG: hypothetical protein D6721_05305 [Gammaproteobacteria bacterium]
MISGERALFTVIRAVCILSCLLLLPYPGTAGAEALVRFSAGVLKSPVRVGEAVVFGGTFQVLGVPADQLAAWPARVRWAIRRERAAHPLAQGEVRIDRAELPFTAQVQAEAPGRYFLVLQPVAAGDGYRYRLPKPLEVVARRAGPATRPLVHFQPAASPGPIAAGQTVSLGGLLETRDTGLIGRSGREKLFVAWKVVRVADGRVADSGKVRLAGARTLLLVSVRLPEPGHYRLELSAPPGAPYRLVSPRVLPVVEVQGGAGR